MLQDTFLPSLVTYVERYLEQGSAASPEESYDALRTYVMLYDQRHFKREDVWRWFQARGDQLLPGAGPDDQKALKVHFDALYGTDWVDPGVPRNDTLIARVRSVIGRDSLPARIYERLKREPVPDGIRDFVVTEKAGPKAMLVFDRASREPLTKGVAGFYTKDGYYKSFLTRVSQSANQLAEEESWVLGTSKGGAVNILSSQVGEGVRRLYLEDYRRIWRGFINDIIVIQSRDLPKTIEITRARSEEHTSELQS